MKIWRTYVLGKLIKTFLLFLFCLVAIYIVVDLSAHGVRFLSKSSFSEIIIFYLYTFASLLDLFLTLTFLLAAMRTLFDLNQHREIVALQMAGISKKKLLTPFFLLASFLSLVCYFNTQWLAPDAQEIANAFKLSHKSKNNKTDQPRVFSVSLKDDSELIYHRFDKQKKELFDVFWICSPTDIWHMKTLKIDSLEGRYVHHLGRNGSKQLEKLESFEKKDFSNLAWDDEIVLNRFTPYGSRSISTLFLQAFTSKTDRRIVFSHLYYKLLVPLMPLFALFAIAPISMLYSRNRPTFLITAYSIFGFIALKITLDGMLILGENQVLPSYVAILGPMILTLSLCLPSFARMK